MKKFLIGGSPCTHWSIAQSKGRETMAEGVGWELFRNYLIAKEKFKPDFFLYENNKSAAQAIKEQISTELEAPLQYINSALVSAQQRHRFYVHNFGDVPQPEDRGILLKDIIEHGASGIDKSYALTTPEDTIKKHRHTMIAEPILLNTTAEGKGQCLRASCYKDGIRNLVGNDVDRRTCIATPIKLGEINGGGQGNRIYSVNGKAITLAAGSGGMGSHTGLYTIPIEGGKAQKIYEVKDGLININGNDFPIKLQDGLYAIRKLTVTEAARLQTMPDNYCRAVSDTQAYKALGNGWTAEVIIYLLSYALKDIPKDEKIVVLSMYDGIGTGRYCFDRLGYHNIEYFAYEIDKFAIRIANSNYPDIIQCGDAFQVREKDWRLIK